MARIVALLGALAALAAASFAVVVGGVVDWLACENEGTPACARQDLAHTQSLLAIVGMAPVVLLVIAAALKKRRLATAALVLAIPLYVTWGVVLDAAVHGWDDLTLNPWRD